MKTSVRFLSMLLAIVMIASAALTASATNAESTANSEALQLLVDLGVFGGYDDGSLKPDQLVERDEMAKIIFVLYTTFTDAGTGVVSFKDVAEDHWAAGFISWCSSKGIVGGFGDGNFKPDDHVTYDQALKMVCGALGYTDWDSRFWPTDVRTKALKDLELGENIVDVKGDDEITRAQVAQIVYNALFANMNETKLQEKELIPDSNIFIQLPVSKTLAVDVWNFKEVNATVTAAGDIGFELVEDEDKDVILGGVGEFALEELGLEEYENKVNDLFLANVRIIHNSDNDEINEDTILATSVTLTGDKDVAITYDEKKAELSIGDEEVDEDKTVELYTIASNGIVSKGTLTAQDVPVKDSLYTSIAYDFDDDGEYDAVYFEYLAAYEVASVNDKKIAVTLYGDTEIKNIVVEDVVSSAALEEEDVVVAANVYNKFVVLSKVEPVVAAATKYSGTKLTLTDVGEVEINKDVFFPNDVCVIDESVMDINEDGTTNKSTYYIYDGKVFGADVVKDNSDINFAIISYFNPVDKENDKVLNETTMKYNVEYTAVVTIDGKQQVVSVNPDDSINGLKLGDDTDYADIIAAYGKSFVKDGEIIPYFDEEGKVADGDYLHNFYVLASYKVDEDGYYSFFTDEKLKELAEEQEFVVYPAGSYIEYNKATEFYSIFDADGNVLTNRVKIDDAAVIYYTYTKTTTSNYTYLSSHAKSTLPENLGKIVSNSDIYATYNEDNKFSNVKLLVTEKDAITERKTTEGASYKTDARQLFYCYQNSNQVMAADQKNLNYSYFMRSVYNGTNLAEFTNTDLTAADGATKASYACIYAWDEDTKNYIRVTKSNLEELGITCLTFVYLDEVYNGCLFAEAGSAKYADGVKVESDASIWCITGQYNQFATLTLADVQASIELKNEYNEMNDKTNKLGAIIGTSINEEGEEVVSVVMIQQYVRNASGNATYNATTLIDSFNK